MIILQVNGSEYKAFDKWSEMPLSVGVKLNTLINESMPGKLKVFYDLIAKGGEDLQKDTEDWYKSLEEEDLLKTFPVFYGKVIAIITTIPEDVVEHIDAGQRVSFYKQYCESLVFGLLHYPTDYTVENITSFIHNGVELFLPETKEVMGQQKPFFDRSAIEFTEAADLEIFSKQMAGGKLEVAQNIISILCRPKASNDTINPYKNKVGESITSGFDKVTHIEPYNEDVCLQRAKELSELPMSTVFEVFFCLTKHLHLSNQITAISSLKVVVSRQKELQAAE